MTTPLPQYAVIPVAEASRVFLENIFPLGGPESTLDLNEIAHHLIEAIRDAHQAIPQIRKVIDQVVMQTVNSHGNLSALELGRLTEKAGAITTAFVMAIGQAIEETELRDANGHLDYSFHSWLPDGSLLLVRTALPAPRELRTDPPPFDVDIPSLF